MDDEEYNEVLCTQTQSDHLAEVIPKMLAKKPQDRIRLDQLVPKCKSCKVVIASSDTNDLHIYDYLKGKTSDQTHGAILSKANSISVCL